MNYVEWLRVRNAARTLAIVFGVMLALTLIARIYIAVEFRDGMTIVNQIQEQPGTVTREVTYQGHPRTLIVNTRRHEVLTIDSKPDGGKKITINEPRTPMNSGNSDDSDNSAYGSVHVTTTEGPAMKTTVIDTDSTTSFAVYLVFAHIAGLIIATVLGAAFARENNGHLEFAMLHPVTRERFALGVMAVDLAGIVICEALAVVAMIAGQLFFEIPHLTFQGVTSQLIVTLILMPLAWYAMLNAASASLKRGAGAVIGFAWPVSIVILLLGGLHLGNSGLAQVVHFIFSRLSYLIPLAYSNVRFGQDGNAVAPDGSNILAALILFIVYGALAIVQWRRVEA